MTDKDMLMKDLDMLIIDESEVYLSDVAYSHQIEFIADFILADRKAILEKVCEPLKKMKDKWNEEIGANDESNKEAIELSGFGWGSSLSQRAIQESLNLADEITKGE